MKKLLLLFCIIFISISGFSQAVCGGTFTDSGGANGNYASAEDITTTICPTNPGEFVTVTFTYFDTEATWDGLYVFNGNSITTQQIASTNGAGNVPGGLAGSFWGTTIPGPFTSTSASGCLTFRFRSDGSINNTGWEANVSCGSCTNPVQLFSSNITTNSSTINWYTINGSTSWEVLVLPCNSPPPTASSTGIITNTNPYVLNGLTQNTCYDVYVRSICSATEVSSWSIKTTFTTLATCPKPTNLVSSSITSSSATLAWTNNSSAANFEVIAVPCGAAPPTNTTTGGIITSLNPFTFTNLNPATCYNLYVRAICSASDVSNWSVGLTVTTMQMPPVCGGNFIDSGGVNATYANNEDITTTICPTTPNGLVTVTFTSFSTEATWDGLYIFNGNSINASQISSTNGAGNVPGGLVGSFWGNLTGANLPGPFTSSSADGCLTFRFRSDSSVVNPGWIANITCASSDRIILNAFVDLNNNGTKDAGELDFNHGNFLYDINNSGTNTIAFSPTGNYVITDANSSNSYNFGYQLQPEYAPYNNSGTTTYSNITIPTSSGSQVLYFPIQQTQTYNDVTISIAPLIAPRPGLNYTNRIIYKNNGTATASGTVTFVKPTPVTTVTPTQTGTTANANGFTYNYINLLANETRSFYVTMTVPAAPTVNINDLLTATASISVPSGDIDLTNNTSSNSQIVVNSYDPNDKMESRGDKIQFSQFSPNDYFYYTVRFENTGTASAINIRITDVLNAKIDETTLRMVSSSHDYKMNRIGNNITWLFDNIQLPVSVANTLTGKGYVTFKVKLKPGFASGDIIPNFANIFFDTNPAIVTNTFNSKFITTLATTNFESNQFIVYPNPARETITVSLPNSSELIDKVTIYDMLGKSVKTISTINNQQITTSVSEMSKGIYILEMETTNHLKISKKLVIQ